MPPSMVGLLAAVGAAMFALVGLAHGVLFLLTIVVAAAATGLAAYGALLPPLPSLPALLPIKKTVTCPPALLLVVLRQGDEFAARLSGLASGLALAVRPAGSTEVSGTQERVLKIVSAERSETIFGCP